MTIVILIQQVESSRLLIFMTNERSWPHQKADDELAAI